MGARKAVDWKVLTSGEDGVVGALRIVVILLELEECGSGSILNVWR